MSADTSCATSDVSYGIAVGSLRRQEKRNALNLAMWRKLAEIFEELGERSDQSESLPGLIKARIIGKDGSPSHGGYDQRAL